MTQSNSSAHRLVSLDILRGLALLGILMMNIIAFAYPHAIYSNPFAMGPLSASELAQWVVSDIFFAEKFYTLFSVLFGAGIVLMAEQYADKTLARRLHYRRMFWLLLIGLLHGFVLWWGDILVTYALAGMLVYRCRNWSIRRLFTVSLLLQVLMMLVFILFYWGWDFMSAEEQQLTRDSFWPTQAQLAEEIAAYSGAWWERSIVLVGATFEFLSEFLPVLLLRICGLMMAGMALYKSGILLARRSISFYRTQALVGVIVGTLICSVSSWLIIHNGYELPQAVSVYRLPNYWGALITAWGYLCLIMWLVKYRDDNSRVARLTNRLAAVGRLALSNYLLQTLICTFIFYGWGLGLFAEFNRLELVVIVFGIWMIQLLLSEWWLRHFSKGPMESLWRALYNTNPAR